MTPETTQVLGAAATLYGLGGALSVLLQARRMHVRGTSGDVSLRFFGVYVGGFAVWLLYGLGIGDVPVIVVHAVGLLSGTVTLAVALRLAAAPPPRPRRSGQPPPAVGAGRCTARPDRARGALPGARLRNGVPRPRARSG